ncbi:hypothetical protein CTAYLR_002382 [Chrysophaeum taylorii]|uniref:Amidohydrolase-related domain-containing protein n=1 Tax=Chrysophaeum taylorii TaxID=2483200 RepID=A0AAD7UIV2_9STRA|nr:hypothetical protein CTAYLR_002382 [Chrysophaeum taylorii]
MEDLKGVEIVDPHVHYWSPATHSWLRGALNPESPAALRRFASVAKDFWPEDHVAALAPLRLTHAVYIQANFHNKDVLPVEETAFVAGVGLGHRGGLPQAFVTYAPLHRPSEARRSLESSKRYDGFRGVRFMLDYHPTRPELCQTDSGDYMERADFLEGAKLVEDMDLVFELQVCQCQLLAAAGFVAKLPKLRVVLNHAGFPLRGEKLEWQKGMSALASRPNVYCKLGGFGCYDDPKWTQEEVSDYVHYAIQAFGVDRCMFASNLPVDLIDVTPLERYASFFRAVKEGKFDDEKARAKLFRENAISFYRLF